MAKHEFERDYYDDEGEEFGTAWTVLREHYEKHKQKGKEKPPPSLEVFMQGFSNSTAAIPAQYAQYLVQGGKK